jgi:hypothetical protein
MTAKGYSVKKRKKKLKNGINNPVPYSLRKSQKELFRASSVAPFGYG